MPETIAELVASIETLKGVAFTVATYAPAGLVLFTVLTTARAEFRLAASR